MTVAWLVILGVSYLFFEVLLPSGSPIHVKGSFTLDALARVGFTFGLGVGWFVVMFVLRYLYIRGKRAD
jgi:hypothetical protein